MLLPYVFILLLLLAFLASLAQALATQLLPIFLLVCALFTAVAASANTQDEERLAALEKTMQELQKEDEDEDSQTQK
jgi:cell division protein FtsL